MPSCEICDDTTWKTITVDGTSRVTRCDCWHQRLYDSLMRHARIPRRYAHCELSNFDKNNDSQIHAHRMAARLVEKFPVIEKGLLFYGETGVGKTHLAVALMREAIRRKGATAVFYEASELMKLVRDTYNKGVEATELEVLNPVLKADLLVLDDLGRERKSEWVEETLGLIINTRYSERRATVFTSNLSDIDSTEPTSFAFQIGLRNRSRLLEMCDWIKVDGPDAREVGPHPTSEDIEKWERTSPASPKRRGKPDGRAELPPKAMGQAKAQLKERYRGDKVDLKWPGGRAGSK